MSARRWVMLDRPIWAMCNAQPCGTIRTLMEFLALAIWLLLAGTGAVLCRTP